MKKILISIAFLLMVPLASTAGYFRTIDLAHPQLNGGFSIHGDTTKATTLLALVTHSPKDGYFLIPNVDWTPLAVGGGFKGGSMHLAAGPSINLLPAVQGVLFSVVDAITAPEKYANLKSLLKTGKTEHGDIVGSIGFNLEYDFNDKAFTVPLFAGVRWAF